MSDIVRAEQKLTRRKLLATGGAIAAAGTVGSWIDPLSALGHRRHHWPQGHLTPADAIRVRESQFPSLGQFRKLHKEADRVGPPSQRGLRATGIPDEAHYVDELREHLERVGVEGLHYDPVPMQRWTTSKWSLDLVSGTGAGPVKTVSYIPYSGQTAAGGVTGQLAFVPAGSTPAPGSLAGKIAVFDVPLTIIPLSFFTALAYPGRAYDPNGELVASKLYKRPYLNGVVPVLDSLKAAGAAGAVAVLDFPSSGADGSYFPFDGIIRNVPGVYVDRTVGAALKDKAKAGASARLKLPATVKKVTSRNLIGFIPGESSDIVALHCHTDGSNAIEDNGPGAIVAMSNYLARLPRKALPSTIMILLNTGHFAGGNGARAFPAQHKNDLVKRTKAALTIEHLGTREWDEVQPGRMGPTGHWEPGGIFAPGSEALVDASFDALVRAEAAPSGVLKPLDPNANGVTAPAWTGEGQYLFAVGGLPDANYITGPTYLLNWGITTIDKLDFHRVRREAIAFTEEILRLGRTPAAQLRTYTL